MIELRKNRLVVSFPELNGTPTLEIDFKRTLRIPDDGRDYPLPPGLGSFPLRHVDDFGRRVPPSWLQRGGVLLPMWQAEALWICFSSAYIEARECSYPFAVKVAAGKINAVTGERWGKGLSGTPQNYLVIPEQPWLDGFCVEKGVVRQFVAMPLGQGYSAEEQLTGQAEVGGIQVEVFPMKWSVFDHRFPKQRRRGGLNCCAEAMLCDSVVPMGLAPGGRMRQQIFEDPYSIQDWDTTLSSRCFVHLANSGQWEGLTGEAPPTRPPTAEAYSKAGLPWFEYYDAEARALQGPDLLAGLKSVLQTGRAKGESPLPENGSPAATTVVHLRAGLRKHQVRESDF